MRFKECLWVALVLFGSGQLHAAGTGLDPSLQLLKQQALELERDVLILEEQMDHPLVIYLSMEAQRKFKLHSLHIVIDGQLVRTHVYDSNTREALEKGGAQQVYKGALAPGDHELIVYYRNSRAYQRGEKRVINKTLKPQFIEIHIPRAESLESRSQPELVIREWDQY